MEGSALARSRASKLSAMAICLLAVGTASAQGTTNGACVSWSSTMVAFDSVYYVSEPNANGDRVVVGNMSLPTYQGLTV